MLPDAVNYVLLAFEFSSLQHVKLWSTCVLFRRSLRLELTSWEYPAINVNGCLQALTRNISTPADIAPSALETVIFYCFMGYISAVTYYLLLIIITDAVRSQFRCSREHMSIRSRHRGLTCRCPRWDKATARSSRSLQNMQQTECDHRVKPAMATELLQPQDLACGTLFQSSCVIPKTPTDCSDDSRRDAFFREARTPRSVTSDMRRHRKTLTYLQ